MGYSNQVLSEITSLLKFDELSTSRRSLVRESIITKTDFLGNACPAAQKMSKAQKRGDKMDKNKKLLVVGVVLIVSVIVIGFSSSIQGGSYEIKPEITLPESRTDTARAIDAYERVMNRFMNMTEKNLTGINTDVKSIAKKLVLIDCRLTDISTRMARIEKRLGIEQPEKQVEKSSKDEMSNNADSEDQK